MANEPRDNWSKAEVIGKTIAGIFLPIILLYVGNLYTSRQEKDTNARLAHEQKNEIDQRNADRVSTFLNHLASNNATERKLTLEVISYLAQINEFPEALLAVVVSTAADSDPEVAHAGVAAVTQVAEASPEKASAVVKAFEASPAIVQSIKSR